MKWPESLTLIRHAESVYNQQKKLKADDDLYKRFKSAYNKNPDSEDCREIAHEIVDKFPVNFGDHNTPLARDDAEKAKTVGERLAERISVPDVIFVSPYERTHDTFAQLKQGWPELGDVKVIEEERLREQEHGLSLLYWDWRVFNTIHPEQRKLREIQGPYWYRFPQGENVPDVRDRMRSWLSALTRDYFEKNVLGITHHLSIISLRANLERLSAEEFIRLDEQEKPINLGVTTYIGDPNQGTDGKLNLADYNVKLY